jgi:hypothetical protein
MKQLLNGTDSFAPGLSVKGGGMGGPERGTNDPLPENLRGLIANSPSRHVAETEYTGRYPSLEIKNEDESG